MEPDTNSSIITATTTTPVLTSVEASYIQNTSELTTEGRPEWLVILDHTTAIIMTCNTITLMLAMGAATYWREVWHHVKRPWHNLMGMVCQFAFLPALGFGLSLAFSLPPYQALAVLILVCSPGGAFSTFFTYWVDGDLALSIVMTATSSLLAFGLMPLNLWAYSWQWTNHDMKVPFINVFISLAFVTVPVISGMVLRHFNMRWANYVSKICGLLGWVGAIACGLLLVLMYWHVIIQTSINLVATAFLVPVAGVVFSYAISKVVCFSHIVCRTIAIETGCQNMVVAINVMLLSFADPEIRGQMVVFPVLYGLSQLAEVLVTVGFFQLWFYCQRDNVIEEEVESVIDNSLLASVPVPAHRLSEKKIQAMTGYKPKGTPDICRLQRDKDERPDTDLSTYYRYSDTTRLNEDEDETHFGDPLLGRRSTLPIVDGIDQRFQPRSQKQRNPDQATTENVQSPFPYYNRPKSPTIFKFPKKPYMDSPQNSIDMLEEYYSKCEDTNSPISPTLSNKGVPYMFPVTEDDFRPSGGESSPVPYGSPLTTPSRTRWNHPGGPISPDLRSPSPTSPNSPSSLSKTFGFYHNDVRIGQAEQMRTFGRRQSKQ